MIDERQASADPGYVTQPLEAPGVSGYLPQGGRRRCDPLARPLQREPHVVVPTREVVCYECDKVCRIPAAALSATCPHCFAHLSTGDVTLKPGTHRLHVRTLGNVKIPDGVELSHLDVVCHHLQVAGCVNGALRATGSLTLTGHAALSGKLIAHTLVVQRGANAQVSPGISVEQAELHGALCGLVHARGHVRIHATGQLTGPCRAASLQIDPGGRHAGTLTRSDSPT